MTRPLPLAILLLALAALAADAQDAPPPPPERKQPTVSADGTEVFVYLLDRAKVKPVRAEEIWNTPIGPDTIVISLGDPNWSKAGGQAPLQLAARAIQSGGAALIAADSNVNFVNSFRNAQGFNGTVALPSVSIYAGNRAPAGSTFLQNKHCPFVTPIDPPANARKAEWNLFTGLNRIATNRPSYISVPNPIAEFGSALATYPDGCLTLQDNVVLNIDPEKHFFAVGGSGQHPNFGRNYRFLALADPSVFINQMMLGSDPMGKTDNLEFGARVVSYLVEDDNGRRRNKCFLFLNGELVDDFGALRRMMQPPLPLPNILGMQDKLTDIGNKIIDNFEEKDIANKVVVGSTDEQRESRFRYIFQAFMVILLIRAVWYALRRVWASRRPPDGPPPASGGLPPPAKKGKVRGLFDRRQTELLRRNNIYEPVRAVVREMFIAAGAPEEPGKALPEVEISDVVTHPETLVDALTDLWKIAFGPARVVTVQRWKLLEPLFERVRQAHADGKWRFV